jgi:hypothetical protein
VAPAATRCTNTRVQTIVPGAQANVSGVGSRVVVSDVNAITDPSSLISGDPEL